MTGLPHDAAERKTYPIASGNLKYFPDAQAEVAHLSLVANEQHNPGQPLHWAKEKSSDEPDALLRHLVQALEDPTARDDDGILHVAKVAWRGLAWLQRTLDAMREAEAAAEREDADLPEWDTPGTPVDPSHGWYDKPPEAEEAEPECDEDEEEAPYSNFWDLDKVRQTFFFRDCTAKSPNPAYRYGPSELDQAPPPPNPVCDDQDCLYYMKPTVRPHAHIPRYINLPEPNRWRGEC